MAQATYPVLTWATRSLFKMIEPYLVLLRVEFTLQPTITSGPVRSYRTLSPLPIEIGGLLSAALVVGSRPPAVSWHSALWSPDFPPPDHFRHRQRLSWLTRRAVYMTQKPSAVIFTLFLQ